MSDEVPVDNRDGGWKKRGQWCSISRSQGAQRESVQLGGFCGEGGVEEKQRSTLMKLKVLHHFLCFPHTLPTSL